MPVGPHTPETPYPLPEYAAAIYEGTGETTQFQVADDLLILRRKFKVEEAASQVDVFGPLWAVAFANLKPSLIGVAGAATDRSMHGQICFVMPPFELVKWLFSPGRIDFVGIIAYAHWPSDLPQQSYFFSMDHPPPMGSSKEVLEFLRREQKKRNFIETKSSSLALAAKKLLDRSYRDNLSLSEVAAKLGASPSGLTQSFKRSFYLSPLSYRNRMRIGLSKYLMLVQGYSITKAAMEVGFDHLSDYNRAFKKISNETPSASKARLVSDLDFHI